MRSLSPKRRNQLPTEQAFRDELFSEAGYLCEWCREEPTAHQHEIARGASRQAARTSRCASLALGVDCHRVIHRLAGDDAVLIGLAILLIRRPQDFDLREYWRITARCWPDLHEVKAWRERLRVEGSV